MAIAKPSAGGQLQPSMHINQKQRDEQMKVNDLSVHLKHSKRIVSTIPNN